MLQRCDVLCRVLVARIEVLMCEITECSILIGRCGDGGTCVAAELWQELYDITTDRERLSNPYIHNGLETGTPRLPQRLACSARSAPPMACIQRFAAGTERDRKSVV